MNERLRGAVSHFWRTRERQASRQGQASGVRDAGARSAVTGGRQMDGFVQLLRDLLIEAGIGPHELFHNAGLELPGWYRPEKKWDMLILSGGQLIAGIEFKSQVGPSFGNNFNNRTEEAIGSATDLWAAYREGAFTPSPRPWLGYLMLLEESEPSARPVQSREPHFKVFPEFQGASYARRYEIFLTKLIRERLYDASCFLVSPAVGGLRGQFREPNPELTFAAFAASLTGRVISIRRKDWN